MLQFQTNPAWLRSDEYSKKLFFKICAKPFSKRVIVIRGGSRTAATSNMELFVIIVNGFQLLTII